MIEHGIRFDHERRARVGIDEAVFSAGKSAPQLSALILDAVERRGRRLFTRLAPEQLAALPPAVRAAVDYHAISCTGIVGAPINVASTPVAIVAGGSSDLPLASEALRTLAYHGHSATLVVDVGVAGLWRLLEHVDELKTMSAVIVVAGMEGALFSVVAGLVPGVVIALPSSVGYGVAEGGRAALASGLASCAPGVVTVNIDNGYGAACAVLRVLASTERQR